MILMVRRVVLIMILFLPMAELCSFTRAYHTSSFIVDKVARQKDGANSSQRPDDHEGRVDSLKKKAVEAYRLGDLPLMKAYTDSVLQIALELGQETDILSAYINQAIYFSNIGQYDSSLSKYITIINKIDTSQISTTLQITLLANMGNIYFNIEEYGRAENCMDRVIQLSVNNEKKHLGVITAYNVLGAIAHLKNKHQLGYKYALKVMKKAMDTGNKNKVLESRNGVIYSTIKLQEYTQALTFTKETLALYDQSSSLETKASTLIYMGEILIALERYDSALLYLDKAQVIAEANGFLNKLQSLYQLKSEAYGVLRNDGLAALNQEKYDSIEIILERNASNAVSIDLSNISNQKGKAAERQHQLTKLGMERNVVISILIISAVIFAITIFFYQRRKRHITAESAQIFKDFQIIQAENISLKDSFIKLNAAKTEKKELNGSHKKPEYSLEQAKELMHKILEFMDAEKPYLEFDIKQSKVAEKLGFSPHQLSEILNSFFGQNFNNFINLYRVETAKKLLDDEKFSNFKLIAIGYEAGFKSKTSFNRCFKQLTGLTPSEYRESLSQV